MIKYPISLSSEIKIDNLINICVKKNDNERQCRSTPGHLLHWVYRGDYELIIAGIHYKVKEGDFIYYYNNEDVYWLKNNREVQFYSLAFQAPSFAALDKHKRVFKPGKELNDFKHLIKIMHSQSTVFQNEMIMIQLLKLITQIFQQDQKLTTNSPWTICENILLSQNIFRSTLKEMCQLSNVSQATLGRSCQKETNTSPLNRLQFLRMEKALNLVRHSTMRISEIAISLGYNRIHEFSREFKHYYSHSPKQERESSYQKL
jgi:AraC-like DNA-binding protein